MSTISVTPLAVRLEHLNTTNILMGLLFCLVGLFIHRLFFHRLAGVPGPLIAKHDDIIRLHEKYGPIVRIAPDEVSVVDAAAIKKLYSHGAKSRKTKWYKTWDRTAPVPVFFSETDAALHAALRRRVSGAFAMSALLKYEIYIQDCLDLCISKLHSYAAQKQVVDMSKWTHALTFDIVGELTFGEKLGHLETETDVDDVRKTNTEDFYWSGNLGHFWWQASLIKNPVAETVQRFFSQGSAGVRFQNWTWTKVMKRKDGTDGADREDLLTHFLRMKPLPGKEKLEDMEVLVESVNVMSARADTTAIGMRSCLYYVCQNPLVYKKLQKEIDDFYVLNGLDRSITYLQTQELSCLKAVVSESTRLLPSIAYQLLRYAPEGGLTVDGHFIPAMTPVGVSPLAQNRDPKIWGDDANVFRPERWIESKEQTSFLETHNMTFGGNGPRACIGRNLALVELNKFVAQMMRNFDMEIVDPETPWKIKTYWFMDQTEFNVRLSPRVH